MSTQDSPRPDPSIPGGLKVYFWVLGALTVLRIILGYLTFPFGMLPYVDLLLAVIFLSAPILSLYYASNHWWTKKLAALFFVGGVVTQALMIVLVMYVALPTPAIGLAIALAQAGLVTWCVGLGALLATLVKEKNILLPISVFLAAYDFFLVLAPSGFTQKLLKIGQPVFTKVAGQIPAASDQATGGLARAGAYVGMADLVFLGMFFIALFRFKMRTRATLFAVIPALVAYLFIVLFFGRMTLFGFSLSALPAMVPIGLTIIIVNWREFDLNKDEKISTVVLAILAVAFVAFAATRPKPPPEPDRRASAPAPAGSAGSPGTASGGRHQ